MTTLRAFLDQREREIKENIRVLREELTEIKVARAAVEPASSDDEGGETGVTIKDMIRTVLKGEGFGLSSGDILKKIEAEFGKRLERTSLSPQLSRLRSEESVTLTNGRWFLRPKQTANPWDQHFAAADAITHGMQTKSLIPPANVHPDKLQAEF